MSYLDDPRVFFAAERTLLAWQRTSIAIIGLGFVFERFGLFTRLLAASKLPGEHGRMSFAAALVCFVLGACVAVISSVQYRRFLRELSPTEVPQGYMTWPGVAINAVLATTAICAAGWMIASE